MDNRKSEILRRIKSLEKRQNKISAEIDLLSSELNKICNHERFELKQRREDGSYYDKVKYYKYKQCKDCHLIFHEELIYTGGYE
jgi:hypothetical protein